MLRLSGFKYFLKDISIFIDDEYNIIKKVFSKKSKIISIIYCLYKAYVPLNLSLKQTKTNEKL
jgi:hypothetical protein